MHFPKSSTVQSGRPIDCSIFFCTKFPNFRTKHEKKTLEYSPSAVWLCWQSMWWVLLFCSPVLLYGVACMVVANISSDETRWQIFMSFSSSGCKSVFYGGRHTCPSTLLTNSLTCLLFKAWRRISRIGSPIRSSTLVCQYAQVSAVHRLKKELSGWQSNSLIHILIRSFNHGDYEAALEQAKSEASRVNSREGALQARIPLISPAGGIFGRLSLILKSRVLHQIMHRVFCKFHTFFFRRYCWLALVPCNTLLAFS